MKAFTINLEKHCYESLKPGGHLLLTYNAMWPEVPGDDPSYFRFTRAGIDLLLGDAGFEIVVHEERAQIMLGDFPISLGGGVVAVKR